jgi:hypothetical protein
MPQPHAAARAAGATDERLLDLFCCGDETASRCCTTGTARAC